MCMGELYKKLGESATDGKGNPLSKEQGEAFGRTMELMMTGGARGGQGFFPPAKKSDSLIIGDDDYGGIVNGETKQPKGLLSPKVSTTPSVVAPQLKQNAGGIEMRTPQSEWKQVGLLNKR